MPDQESSQVRRACKERSYEGRGEPGESQCCSQELAPWVEHCRPADEQVARQRLQPLALEMALAGELALDPLPADAGVQRRPGQGQAAVPPDLRQGRRAGRLRERRDKGIEE